jgi:antitoxin component of RelBE/YafQ-DinJ toxin-antitoxin module
MNKFQKKISAVAVAPKTKSKSIAEVTEEIQTKVDKYVDNKATLKQLEADQLTLEADLIAHVRPQQDEMAFCGSHTKSMKVPGHNYELTYCTMDKFSVPQDETSIKAIKDLVKDKYDDMFEAKETISIKAEVLKDDKTMNKMADACEKAGLDISTIFDRVEKIVAKDDLDVKQYTLGAKLLETFRSLVRQAKPSLR